MALYILIMCLVSIIGIISFLYVNSLNNLIKSIRRIKGLEESLDKKNSFIQSLREAETIEFTENGELKEIIKLSKIKGIKK